MKRTKKKIKKKTPGGKNVIHFRKKRSSHALCSNCGAKLNRPRLKILEIRKLPKTKKRPERPTPNFCPKCMKEYFKNKVRE